MPQLLVCLIVMVSIAADSAFTQTVEWTRYLDVREGDDRLYSISTNGQGNLYIAGETKLSEDSYREYLSMFDSDGNEVWTDWAGVGVVQDIFEVYASPEGDAYLVGQTWESAERVDAYLQKYSTTGDLGWTEIIDAEETPSWDRALAIDRDRTGGFFVSGVTDHLNVIGDPNEGDRDAFLSRFESDGSHLWTHEFGTVDEDLAYGISTDDKGNVFVAGQSGEDAFLSLFDEDGIEQWTTYIDRDGRERSEHGVVADGQGNAYLLVQSSGKRPLPTTRHLLKFDSEGEMLWEREFPSSFARASGLTLGANDDIYFASREGLLRLDAEGEVVWNKPIDHTVTFASFDGDGSVYVAGRQQIGEDADGNRLYDVAISKVDIDSVYLVGDYNFDGQLTSDDADLFSLAVQESSPNLFYDLTGDSSVSVDDLNLWISDIATTLPGDTNLDSKVEFVDFLVVSANFGNDGIWSTGDFDGDGLVAFSDFLLLSENFGFTAAKAVSVPEPASYSASTLLCFALLLLWIRRTLRTFAI